MCCESCEDCKNGNNQLTNRQIGELLPRGQQLTHVHPCCLLEAATLIMREKNYSQLPVMSHDGKVEGIITWESIGKRAFSGGACKLVSDCMESSVIKTCLDDPLVDPTGNIAEYGYVLVMRDDGTVKGILTASDLAKYFGEFAKGFLAIEEIESRLERLIDGKFTDDEKLSANKGWKIGDGLTLGHYYYLLEPQENWNKLRLDICHEAFMEQLEAVKCIRNRLMHFDARELRPEDIEKLYEFLSLLRGLEGGA